MSRRSFGTRSRYAMAFGFALLVLPACAAPRGRVGVGPPEDRTGGDASDRGAVHPPRTPDPRRNVLFVFVDDLAPRLGCYGDTLARSPTIDALASRGILFERAYCNQAVCSPSRNALLTGLRPQTLGIYDLGTNFRDARPDAVTLGQAFQAGGWITAAYGKIFHTGHGNHEDPASWSIPHWSHETEIWAEPFTGKPPFSEALAVPDETYPDARIADRAILFLEEFAASGIDSPFFLAVGFVRPHLPFNVPRRYWELFHRDQFALRHEIPFPPIGSPDVAATNWGELRSYRLIPSSGPLPELRAREVVHGYYASVSYVDSQLQRVLKALDRGPFASNTLIVLWGDHGFHLGDHGFWAKHTNYEEATRVPLLIAGPGIPAGARTTALVEGVDVYPTLCELAGTGIPPGQDAVSFADVIRDPALPARSAITHVFPRGEVLGRAIRTDRWRMVEWKIPGATPESAELEFYDLEEDPREIWNRAAERPGDVAALREILAAQGEAAVFVPPQGTVARGKRAKISRPPSRGNGKQDDRAAPRGAPARDDPRAPPDLPATTGRGSREDAPGRSARALAIPKG